MKAIAHRLFAHAGLQVSRGRLRHRFNATADALSMMCSAGFQPRVIIDAGANVGAWTRIARCHFPQAVFHLIEPQAACVGALEEVATDRDRIHQVAIAGSGATRLRMVGGGPNGTGTGARVSHADESPDAIEVDATTLDALLLEHVQPTDRALLKLDLEGYETEAMRGAEELLSRVEAIFTEVRFFDINLSGLPVFSDLLRVTESAGFVLYDIASLASRPRDDRLRLGDVVFVSTRSPLVRDVAWD